MESFEARFHRIEGYWRDESNWILWHTFYHCRDDPRPIVPKRFRWTGWTFNIAHPQIVPVFLLVLILGAGPAFYLVLEGLTDPILFVKTVALSIFLVILLSWNLARIR